MFVEILVVLARAESSIFLLNKEEWGSLWGLGLSNFARLEMFVNEHLTCLYFFWVHGVGFGHLWDEGLL